MVHLFRYGTFPIMLVGFNGAFIFLIGAGAPAWQSFLLLFVAIVFMFVAERVVPYIPAWNQGQGDRARDLLHFIVNTTSNHVSLLFVPVVTALGWRPHGWPSHWPFWVQVLLAILLLDLGVSAAHDASHKWGWLWRFHAVHHSVRRLYGFNGLMKHPVHQAIEAVSGFTPLLVLGVPMPVATALTFCVAIQLLLQHSNADYRSGPLTYVFANAEVHRFHHRKGGAAGDVNFGLFTTLWDHAAGTFFYRSDAAPKRSDELGIDGEDQYPTEYFAQLAQPFRAGPAQANSGETT